MCVCVCLFVCVCVVCLCACVPRWYVFAGDACLRAMRCHHHHHHRRRRRRRRHHSNNNDHNHKVRYESDGTMESSRDCVFEEILRLKQRVQQDALLPVRAICRLADDLSRRTPRSFRKWLLMW